jgi:phage tail sheath protein FI
MAINLVSPGVKITEADLVKTIPATGGTVGGTAGNFRWGPIEDPVLVTNEAELVAAFGTPNATNAVDFLNVTNFLSYSGAMQVVRAANTTAAKNATAEATTGGGLAGTGILIKNDDAYEASFADGSGNVGPWAAKYAGDLGNSLRVSACPSASAWQSNLTGTFTVAAGGTVVTGSGSTANTQLVVGDIVVLSGRSIKVSAVTNATSFTLASAHPTGATAASGVRRWEYYDSFDSAPGTSPAALAKGASGDELHVVVVDEGGYITGTAGNVLEKYAKVSKGSDARSSDGGSNYYKDVVNTKSKYVRWMDHDGAGSNWGTALKVASTPTVYTAVTQPKTYSLAGGAEGAPTDGNLQTAFTLFANKETIDISVIPVGAASAAVINTVIGDVAEVRKDIMVCFSPLRANVVNNAGSEATSIASFADTITRSTYAVMDGNWKYQYNKYTDSYVYVPCNADVAGCMARTDNEAAPWFSPAGYTRGVIKNAVKLAWNPKESERDVLYKTAVNPVITQTGRGTILFGDKTFVTTTGSFSRINVRRLFIQLEKSIGGFASNLLFDQNDDATRAGFVDTVEPYLRSVQAQRGMTQFAVVCNETNNPEDVVNANEFVADIYIRPVSSINFIQLNFVSVAGASAFSVIGA